MESFVLNTVLKHFWFASKSHYSHNVRPSRVSPTGGSKTNAKVAGRRYPLPATTVFKPAFHIYQIGQLPMHYFGIFKIIENRWLSVEEIAKENSVFIEVVADNGVTLSPRNCWLMKSAIDRNVILAVMENRAFDYGSTITGLGQEFTRYMVTSENGTPIAVNLNNENQEAIEVVPASLNTLELKLRFYFNHYTNHPLERHNSERSLGGVNASVNIKCITPVNRAQLDTFITEYHNHQNLVYFLANGRIYHKTIPANVRNELVGKEISVLLDTSVKATIFFDFDALPTYTMPDGSRRHVIELNDSLDSHRDVSLYAGTLSGTNFFGINLENNIGNVTYQLTDKIIALNDAMINELRMKNVFLDEANRFYIMVVIRSSTLPKSYSLEASRLDILNRLATLKRHQIMMSETIHPEWNYQKLETSQYGLLPHQRIETMTEEKIVEMLGFVGLQKLFTPAFDPITQRTISGKIYKEIKLPIATRHNSKIQPAIKTVEVLSYNSQGLLLQSKYLDTGVAGTVNYLDTNVSHTRSRLIKDVTFDLIGHRKITGTYTATVNGRFFGFRAYVRSTSDPGQNYTLAIEGTHYNITLVNGVPRLTWINSYLTSHGLVGVVVEDGLATHYSHQYNQLSLGRDYIILNIAKDSDGLKTLEPERIEIYMDDLMLFEDIDYVIVWDKIIIHKPPVNQTTKIRVLFSGLSLNGKHSTAVEMGWVDNRRICFDHRREIYRNKEMVYNIAGYVLPKNLTHFADESGQLITAREGRPYAVYEHNHPIESYIQSSSTLAELNIQKAYENRLVDVLNNQTPLLPYSRTTASLSVNNCWKVISIFMNEFLYRLLNQGFLLGWQNSNTPIVASAIDPEFEPIKHLLTNDICFSQYMNENFMVIIPHRHVNKKVTPRQRDLINFVNQFYLGNRVRLTGYITV